MYVLGTLHIIIHVSLQAGIARDQLKLALEPEAASIFLQNIPSNMVSEKLPILKSGTKYAIADLGGK